MIPFSHFIKLTFFYDCLTYGDVNIHACVCVIHQPVAAVPEKRLKDLMDRHGTEKLYQLNGPVVAIRDLDLNLNKGELVAVISEMDTRGDRRRWLVDAGGIHYPSLFKKKTLIEILQEMEI